MRSKMKPPPALLSPLVRLVAYLHCCRRTSKALFCTPPWVRRTSQKVGGLVFVVLSTHDNELVLDSIRYVGKRPATLVLAISRISPCACRLKSVSNIPPGAGHTFRRQTSFQERARGGGCTHWRGGGVPIVWFGPGTNATVSSLEYHSFWVSLFVFQVVRPTTTEGIRPRQLHRDVRRF